MPIIGLTDNITPRFPLLGRLRKGSPQTDGASGEDLDHFRFSPATGHDYLTPIFNEAYGPTPKYLEAWLAYDTLHDAFPTWMDEYDERSGALLRRCDGHTLYRWRDERGWLQHRPKPCQQQCEGCKCVNRGYLNLILPKFLRNNCIGMVQMQTGYYLDILTLAGNLEAVLRYTDSLKGIEFVLSRHPRNVMVNEAGQLKQVEKYICTITPISEVIQTWFQEATPVITLPSDQRPSPLANAITVDVVPEPELKLQAVMNITGIQLSVVKSIANRVAGTEDLSTLTDPQIYRMQLELLGKFAVNSKIFSSVAVAIASLQEFLDQTESPKAPMDHDLLDQCLDHLQKQASSISLQS